MYKCEILDKQTKCSYIKEGKTILSCVQSFNNMFLNKHPYSILSVSLNGNYLEALEIQKICNEEASSAFTEILNIINL